MKPSYLKKTVRQTLAYVLASLLILGSVPFHDAGTALAFKPTEGLKGTPNDITHEKITEEAIRQLIENENYIPGVNKITPSMRKAIDKIKDGNVSTDLGTDFFVSEAHATEESFSGVQSRLQGNLNRMILNLADSGKQNKPDDARQALGTTLHTIQDFYSHSNWVEIGNYHVSDVLGRDRSFTNTAAPNEATCNGCNKCSDCNNNVTRSKLTTSYYGLYPTSTKPAGKCSHGAKPIRVNIPNPLYPRVGPPFFTRTVIENPDTTENEPARGGISKDSLDCEDAPHSFLHRDAAGVALRATKDYLKNVVKASPRMTTSKLKKLFGVGRGLAFAVDTTGSMGDQIAQVRQQLTQIVNERLGTELEPSKYVLMPFNDPDVGPITVTEDAQEFLGAIASLDAGGGGDCPEKANTGMLQALTAIDEGGELMVVTDASAIDNHLAGSVQGLAESKEVKVNFIATGSCSPIDPEYYRTASATGGQVFVISGHEVENMTKLAGFVVRPSAVEALSATATLLASSKTYAVAIDSTVTRATFSVSGTSNVVLERPDGSLVQPTDAGVEIVRVTGEDVYADNPERGAVIYSITAPTAGMWRVTATGDGRVSYRVSVESPLTFPAFNFVELAGGPGHEGFARISGLPIAGSAAQAAADLSAAQVQTARFELRAEDGEVIQNLDLNQIPDIQDAPAEFAGGSLSKKYFGGLIVPNKQFMVYAVGTDANGQPFQRLYPGLTKPRTVKVKAQPMGDLHPGQTTTYSFQVENLGPAGIFRISASDEQGYIQRVTPMFLKLGSYETKAVTLQMRPPADAVVGTVDTLTLAAQNLKSTDASNSAVVQAKIAAASPVQLGNVTPVAGGDGDAIIEAGENASLNVRLVNTGVANATNVRALLATMTPGITIMSGDSTYPEIAPAGEAANITPFTFKLASDVPCGQDVNFMLLVRHDGLAEPVVYNFSIPTGPSSAAPTSAPATVSYAGSPAAISGFSGVSIPIEVSGFTGDINDLNLRLDSLDYPYVGPLEIKLTSPQGTTITLVEEAWNGGTNFRDTLFDDEGGGPSIKSINWWEEPHSGTFTPVNPLATFQGENPNGTWSLSVRDPYYYYYYSGSVNAFSLILSTVSSNSVQCSSVPVQQADLSVKTVASPDPVASGSNITFTTTVTNNGPGAASAVQVSNILPAETAFVSCAATDGGVCGGLGNDRVVTFDSLPAGASATITIVAAMQCDLADLAVLTNTATASSSTPDPDPSNNSATAIFVVANPAPVISNASVDKPELWPPNHKMIDVTVSYNVTDNCGPLTNTLSVTSNEPVEGSGDGNTSPDWEIVDAYHVRLRAERSGGGNGRIYTITITSTDSKGNSSSRAVTVRVPKSRGK